MSYSNNQEHDEFFDPIEPQQPKGNSPAPYTPPYTPAPQSQKKSQLSKRIFAVVMALVLLGLGFLAGWLVRYYTIDEEQRAFLWALKTTEKYYYQEIDKDALYASVDESKGAAGLMEALNKTVDQYSGYYTLDEFQQLMAEGEGQNVGIGVSLTEEELNGTTYMKVAILVENSPAQKAGVLKGMYIFGFGTTESTVQYGDYTALSVFLQTQGVNKTFYMEVGFEKEDTKIVPLKAQDYQAAYCYYRDSETSYSFRGDSATLRLEETYSPIPGLDDTTAYIRIDEFSGNADGEFLICLETMQKRGRSNLILDLRCNGGGYLNIFQSIASHLLKNADESFPLVATANYRSGKTSRYRTAVASDYDNYFTDSSKVYLLADEFTASASECLIGALVDYGTLSYNDIYLRAEADGSGKSYGKGIMQSFFPSTLGVMKLTVATINWPVTGTCIHGKGVTTGDGAHGIVSDLFWGKDDVMLNAVIADVCGGAVSGVV